jgi:hypothetical protein
MMSVRANGVWNPSAITLSANQTAQLLGVSCTSSTFCAAVGQEFVSGKELPLVATFNGLSWSAGGLIGKYAVSSHLSAVSCVVAKFCVAVGTIDHTTGADTPIAAIFNGSSWSLAPLPLAGSIGRQPKISVSCGAIGHCVSVVSALSAKPGQSIVETLSGSTWHAAPMPQPASQSSLFVSSISCADALHCVAVGHHATKPVIESLVGSSWTQTVLSVGSVSGAPVLLAVSCRSVTSCVAVGSTHLAGGVTAPFVARLAAGHWSVGPAPAIVAMGATKVLDSISCAATTTSCTAAGYSDDGVSRTAITVDIR